MSGTFAPRAEHVGSLLRPAELQKAWGAVFAGQMDRADMAEIEDRAIVAALAGQSAIPATAPQVSYRPRDRTLGSQ